jgi:hypothetical protein
MSDLSRLFARITGAALIALVLDVAPAAADGAVAGAASFAGNSVAPSHASSRSRQRATIVFADDAAGRFHASSRTRLQPVVTIAPTEALRFHASSRTRLRIVQADDIESTRRFHASSRTRGGSTVLTTAAIETAE